MKFFLNVASIMTGLLVFNACQKPVDLVLSQDNSSATARVDAKTFHKYTDEAVSGQYQLRNGILCFKDAQSFMQLDSIMRTSSYSDLIKFAEKTHFVSLLTLNDSFYSALSKVSDESEYNKLVSENKDIVQLSDGKVRSLFNLTSAWAMNKHGIVSIGGRIHCFSAKKTITGSNAEMVIKTFQTDVVNKGNKSFTNSSAKVSSPCDIYSLWARNSGDTRHIQLDVQLTQRFISTGYDQNGETGNAQWSCYLFGSAKKRVPFGFSLYDTDNYLVAKYNVHIRYENQSPNNGTYTDFFRTVDKPQQYRYTSNIDDNEVLLTLPNARNNADNQYNWHYQASVSNSSYDSAGMYWTTGVPDGVRIICF